MKKVLIVFNHPAPYKVRLFNQLAKRFDLHVIFERNSASDRQKGFYFENKYDFITHEITGIKVGRENFISSQIIKHLKNNKYDLVIMNGYSTFAEMKTINFLKRNNVPYIFYINGGLIKQHESIIKKKIKTHFIKDAIAYLSPDETSNKYLIYYGADKNKIFNYPYSTIYENEICKTKPDKNKIKEKLGITYDKLFVSSGQLIKRKNYLNLVKEWGKMPENYGFFIFGDGNQKTKILKLIKKHNIKNVQLKGFTSRENMFEFFKASDAFLFPSKEDIYGHVVNEALSQGVPVISSKFVNSATHLIKNKFNGYLLDSFEEKNIKLAIDEILKLDLFDNCISTAKENTIELMAEAHEKIFKGI